MGSESWQSHFCEYSTTLAVPLCTRTVVQMERQRAVAKAAIHYHMKIFLPLGKEFLW